MIANASSKVTTKLRGGPELELGEEWGGHFAVFSYRERNRSGAKVNKSFRSFYLFAFLLA